MTTARRDAFAASYAGIWINHGGFPTKETSNFAYYFFGACSLAATAIATQLWVNYNILCS